MKRSPLVALGIAYFLNSCDHIDVVGDKVNELKDLRKATTQGVEGVSLQDILDGVNPGPTIQTLNETQFDAFTSKSGRLNIVEFKSPDSRFSVAFQPVLAAVVGENSSVARLGRVDVTKATILAEAQEVGSVPDVRFFLDGKLVYQFTGTESKEAIDRIIKEHSAALVPGADLTAQLNDGLDGLSGSSAQSELAKVPYKTTPIEEAIQPMDDEWLPPGVSRRK